MESPPPGPEPTMDVRGGGADGSEAEEDEEGGRGYDEQLEIDVRSERDSIAMSSSRDERSILVRS